MDQTILARREKQLQQKMSDAGLDAVILSPSPNLTYMTGMSWHQSERATLACLTPNGWLWLVPKLEALKLKPMAEAGATLFIYSDEEGPDHAAKELMTALGSGSLRVGIDPLAMRVFEQQLLDGQSESVIWEDGAALLGEMRIVKDEAEIKALKRAVELTEIVLKKTIDSIEPGQTELQIARRMQQLGFEHHTTMPFAPIVASGPNGGNPHAIPGDRVIQQGDLITFDVGAWLDGYPGDITRNVAVGQIDPKLEEVHELVKQANQAGRAAAGPGVACQDVDRAARKVIEDGGYGEYFIHRTGHGLGLEIHEPPYIVEGNTLPLAPGHVFTVEPGVYIPDLGGVRVEDDCVITADGMESLTTFPRELIKL